MEERDRNVSVVVMNIQKLATMEGYISMIMSEVINLEYITIGGTMRRLR